LADRGHDVVLFEKAQQLGGILTGAVHAPFKSDLKQYLDWSIRAARSYKNIDLRIGAEATAALIDQEKADAMILAMGGKPVIPELSCKDASRVLWVGDIDSGNARIGNNVLIAGAGLTGCETALRFLQAGKKVTLIDALPRQELGSGSSPINAYALFNILAEYDFDLRTETKLVDVTSDYVIVVNKGREEKLVCDTVVLSLGTTVDSDAIYRLRPAVAECHVVGNSNGKSGTVWNATTSAYDAAMMI
jgi:NADPH-dependent 2,4-dienoyl-CoA reductase/sulfur reductase-like enzyme